MNLEEFVCYVLEHLFDSREGASDYLKPMVDECSYYNGESSKILSIFSKEGGMSPVIKIESIYEDYLNGRSLEDCIADIWDIYDEFASTETGSLLDELEDFEVASKFVMPKLINLSRNEELLKKMIHFTFGDLALIFHVRTNVSSNGLGGFRVDRQLMEIWNVDEEKILEAALMNMVQSHESMIVPLGSEEEYADDRSHCIPEVINNEPYTLTNHLLPFGAAGLLRMDMLQEFADKLGMNVFVMPINIHELLLVPDDGTVSMYNLKEMLRMVNRELNPPECILSSSIYYYDREKHQLSDASRKRPMILRKAEERDAA